MAYLIRGLPFALTRRRKQPAHVSEGQPPQPRRRGRRLTSTQQMMVALQEVRDDILCLTTPERLGPARAPRGRGRRPSRGAQGEQEIPRGVANHDYYDYRAVLKVSSVNFGLKSAGEQEAVIAGYAAFLNGLGFHVQILVRVMPLDLAPYLRRLCIPASASRAAAGPLHQLTQAQHDLNLGPGRADAREQPQHVHLAQQSKECRQTEQSQHQARRGPGILAQLAADHEQFVRHLASEHTLLERHFYLVIPAEAAYGSSAAREETASPTLGGSDHLHGSFPVPSFLATWLPGGRRARRAAQRQRQFAAVAQRLDLHVDDVTRQLTRFGVEARRVRGQELVDLYASCLVPAEPSLRTPEPSPVVDSRTQWKLLPSQPLLAISAASDSPVAQSGHQETKGRKGRIGQVDRSNALAAVEQPEMLAPQEVRDDRLGGAAHSGTLSASGGAAGGGSAGISAGMDNDASVDGALAERIACGIQTLPDLIAPAAVELFRDSARIDDQWVRVLAVTGYPRSVYPGWLATLIDFDEPFDLALHIHPLASGAMIRLLSNRMVALHSSRLLDQRHGRLADPEREVAYADMERLRDALQRGDEHVYSFSLYLLVRGRTRRILNERCSRILATLDNLQLQSRPATLEHDLGLTSCLPEARDRLGRYRTFDTSSLATAFPFTSSSLSMPDGVLYGVVPQTGSLVILDPFARELENANQVVFAKSGAGKSYACKLQALRALLLGIEVYIVDPEDEYRPLCAAVNGQYIRLAPGSNQHINPFDLPTLPTVSPLTAPLAAVATSARAGGYAAVSGQNGDDGDGDGDAFGTLGAGTPVGARDDEADENQIDSLENQEDVEDQGNGTVVGDALAEKVQSLHALLDLMLADRTPASTCGLSQREKGLLDRCLYETYRRAGITSDRHTHGRPAPLLRDLYEVIRSGACGSDEYGLADRLHRYVEGSLARLFSAPTDVALDNHCVVFDVRDLDGELRPLGILLIADFVWTRVRQQRRPRLFLFDEAWSLIQHAEGGRFLAGLARRARKHYLGLVTITQDVEDFLSSEWGRTVLANSSIQHLMKQDSTTIEVVSQAFRLSAGERRYLLGCHKGEGLLFARGAHVALRVEASAAEHRLVTTDPRELAERERSPGSNTGARPTCTGTGSTRHLLSQSVADDGNTADSSTNSAFQPMPIAYPSADGSARSGAEPAGSPILRQPQNGHVRPRMRRTRQTGQTGRLNSAREPGVETLPASVSQPRDPLMPPRLPIQNSTAHQPTRETQGAEPAKPSAGTHPRSESPSSWQTAQDAEEVQP